MKQTVSTFLFLLLFALVLTAIFMSARTTFQFASQLNRPSAETSQRAQPTPVAKPAPVATGALTKRSGKLPS